MRRALNLFKKITRVSIEDKSGKPDLDEWIRSKSEIRTYIEQILLDEKALCKKFFNERYIKEIIERHMSYERDYNPQIFILLSFELFLRNFMTDIPANMSHFTKEKGTRGNKKHVACRGC